VNAPGLGAALDGLFQNLTTNFLALLIALAALSALTMAIIQAAKDLAHLPRWFYRYKLRKWFRNQAVKATGRDCDCMAQQAEAALLTLAANDDANSFYDLGADPFRQRFVAAVQLVMEYPQEKFFPLLCLTAAVASSDDLEIIRTLRLDDPDDREKVLHARNRTLPVATGAIDAFMVSSSGSWGRIMQITAFVVSTGLTLLALHFRGSLADYYGGGIVSALCAGFLAPIAHDLMVALRSTREKKQ